jgi:cell wall-associated NlpC family hydrolase
MITRSAIVEVARSWIGTPYRHQGRTRQNVDCIGFVIAVAADLGVTIVAPHNYSDSPSGEMMMARSREQFDEVTDRTLPRPGDIMGMWGWNRNEPQHFAIAAEYGGRQTMIHAFSKRGMVVEHSVDSFWNKRLVALFNLKGMEQD